jgi:hypothetical protein
MSVESQVQICSRALVLLGESPIAAFDGSTAGAIIAKQLYESTRDQLYASYPWRFAQNAKLVTKMTSDKRTKYDSAYQIPSDCERPIGLRRIGSDGPLVFEIFGNEIHCDVSDDQLELDYLRVVDEEFMPAWFVAALENKLAARFAIPVSQSPSLAGFYDEQYEREYRRARFADSLIDAPNTIEPTRFVTVRR